MSRFFDPGEQRAAKVNDLFERIAPRYELINDLQSFGLHRYWKRRVIRLAEPKPGLRALDVCCGTGDIALALAGRGAEVIGLDFSERMLAVAERRKSKLGKQFESQGQIEVSPAAGRHPALQFLRGDALRLPFAAETFDIVTVGYGLRNLADWEAGLREMQRVAGRGGRVIVLEFGKPEHPLWRRLYFGYLRLFVPMLGRIFWRDAGTYAYILESLNHYPAQRVVAAKMSELGLSGVRVLNLLGGAMSINYAEKPGGRK